MESDVTSLSCVSKVSDILIAIKTSHHGFPVLNLVGNATGLIPRNFLIILLRERAWYSEKIDIGALKNLQDQDIFKKYNGSRVKLGTSVNIIELNEEHNIHIADEE